MLLAYLWSFKGTGTITLQAETFLIVHEEAAWKRLICYRRPRHVNWSQLKWDRFEILAKGRSITHCKIKTTLLV